ncbi:MAG: hypothetical protein KAQ88_05500, partial [Hyphomicrobiaceae bacterium]|nr:hypothetical protein [Hyphomicrobiaceae bacterium]
ILPGRFEFPTGIKSCTMFSSAYASSICTAHSSKSTFAEILRQTFPRIYHRLMKLPLDTALQSIDPKTMISARPQENTMHELADEMFRLSQVARNTKRQAAE